MGKEKIKENARFTAWGFDGSATDVKGRVHFFQLRIHDKQRVRDYYLTPGSGPVFVDGKDEVTDEAILKALDDFLKYE